MLKSPEGVIAKTGPRSPTVKPWMAAMGILLCCFGCKAPATNKTPESSPALAMRVWGYLEQGPEGTLLRWSFIVENHGTAPLLVNARRYSAGYDFKVPGTAGGGCWWGGPLSRIGTDKIYQLLPPVSADWGPRIGGESLRHEGVQQADNLAPEYLEHVTVSVTLPVLEVSVDPESGQMLYRERSVDLKARLEPGTDE
jgi:hypothetical protein